MVANELVRAEPTPGNFTRKSERHLERVEKIVKSEPTPTVLRQRSEGQIRFLGLEAISESAWNPNEMYNETFESLTTDMKQSGIYSINPIQVFAIGIDSDGSVRYQIADGHNRFRAAQKLGWEKIRAEIFDIDEDKAKALNYRKNRERGTLNPLKEARLFFEDWGKGKGKLTQQQIADTYGISQQQVSERLLLLDMPAAAQEAVETGSLPASHAEEIHHSVVKSPKNRTQEVQAILAKVASNKRLAPDQTRQLAQKIRDQLAKYPEMTEEAIQLEAEQIAKEITSPRLTMEPDYDFLCPRCHNRQFVFCDGFGARHRVRKVGESEED